MIHTICYVSSASNALNNSALEKLFESTKKNNIQNNISGILLYYEGNFIQILEGEESFLKQLFQKIKLDKRHQNLITLINKKNKDRIFESYETSFSIVTKQRDMDNLKEYLTFLKNNMLDSNHYICLLKPFFKL